MIFNDVDFSQWMHCDPQRPLMPPITITSQTIPGKDGRLLSPSLTTLDSVEIPVTCFLLPEESSSRSQARMNLEELKRKIASLLLTKEESKLILDGEPHRYYRGVLQNAGDIERVGVGERFTLTFLCSPVAYAHPKTVQIKGTQEVLVFGSYRTLPLFEIISAGSVSYLKITNMDTGEFVQVNAAFTLNTRLTIDMEKKQAFINGSPIGVTLTSDFFSLEPGKRRLNLSSGTAMITYEEAWL